MKTFPLFIAFMAVSSPARAQDAGETALPDRPAPATAARIIGAIIDGTPPPPAPPKPAFVVPAKDVLATTTQEQGGRTITIQKVKPIALPEPPTAATGVPTEAEQAAFRERQAQYLASHPPIPMLSLGVTVYRFKDSPPRSLVRYWPRGGGEPLSFWSSADFSLIAGIRSFVGTDGLTYGLTLLPWGSIDVTRLTEASGGRYHPPDIPAFPDGPASFSLIGTAPPADFLVAIQSLHDIYNSEFDRLKAAFENRQQVHLQQEADLKANPPKPRNIRFNYWRTEKPAQTEGGAK